LGLGRQAAPGPVAVGLGLPPRDVDQRAVAIERAPAIELAAEPVPSLAAKVERRLGARGGAPCPAGGGPELLSPGAAVLGEGGEGAPGARGAGDRKSVHL